MRKISKDDPFSLEDIKIIDFHERVGELLKSNFS